MQPDTKDRFEQIDKRFDDLKSYLSVGSGIFTVIFAIVSIMFTWNLQSEKTHLLELEKELKEEVKTSLGKSERPPRIELYTLDQKILGGQKVVASFEHRNTTTDQGKSEENVMMTIKCIFKNESESLSGPISIKLYTKEPLKFSQIRTDKSEFDYEYFIAPEYLTPSEMPGGLSLEMFLDFYLEENIIPNEGVYPALLEVFYGKGQINRTPFNILIENKTN